MNGEYHIVDEPVSRPSPVICNPFWVLLAGMLGGAWIAALLFLVNGVLLHGPRWKLETFLSIALLPGSPLILYSILACSHVFNLPLVTAHYFGLLIIVWKLAIYYWLFFLQQSTYALYEYFVSGTSNRRSLPVGMIYLGFGVMLRPVVMSLYSSVAWKVMVG